MKTRTLLAAALLLANTALFAHTGLTSSTPTNNAMLNAAPTELSLSFGAKVRLVALHVQDSKGKTIETGFKASTEQQKTFTQKLPNLSAETYTVHWVTMGSDMHKMNGDLSFMVHGSGGAMPAPAATPPAADHHAGGTEGTPHH